MSAATFLVSGEVQGVGYRWFVARHSRQLGLRGHARNLPDGRVEVVAAGSDDSLAQLEILLRSGPAHATVRAVERTNISDEKVSHNSFEIM